MASLDEFRRETRAWLEENAPEELRGTQLDVRSQVWGGSKEPFHLPGSREWLERAVERGLAAPAFPTEYGGAGLSKQELKVWRQELGRLQMPPPLIGFGLDMIGPTLLTYGNDALKQQHLPKITSGAVRWCQGYSEPNAGSDLASVQTSARVDGDDYVLNGQKVWTSYGDLSDWMFMLVRTDPDAKKQAGITFLLVDVTTPGITIQPIKLISGASPFCETFFEDVRVPRANVVHEVNAGWTVAKALLGHERNMIGDVFGARAGRGARKLPMVDLARRFVGPEQGPIADPVLRDRISQLMMDESAFAFTMKRSSDAAKAGQRPGAESSIFKVYGTELNQRREELRLAIRGPQALGWEGEGFEEEDLAKTRDWLRSRGNTIEGGTSEVQLNIIAKHVLGLPD